MPRNMHEISWVQIPVTPSDSGIFCRNRHIAQSSNKKESEGSGWDDIFLNFKS